MCFQFLHPHSAISFHFSTETLDRSQQTTQRWFMRIYQVFTDSEKQFSLLHKVMSWFLTVMSFTWSLSWQQIYESSVELEKHMCAAPFARNQIESQSLTSIGICGWPPNSNNPILQAIALNLETAQNFDHIFCKIILKVQYSKHYSRQISQKQNTKQTILCVKNKNS